MAVITKPDIDVRRFGDGPLTPYQRRKHGQAHERVEDSGAVLERLKCFLLPRSRRHQRWFRAKATARRTESNWSVFCAAGADGQTTPGAVCPSPQPGATGWLARVDRSGAQRQNQFREGFDLVLPLDRVAEGYRATDERRAIKALLRP